jgi:predicted lipid-binding transport protein (Tim44 family)
MPATPVPATPVPTPVLANKTPASPTVVRPNEVRPDTAAPPSRGETVGMLPTGANPAPPTPASKPAPASTPARTIDAEAVKLLLTQGEQFVHAGDLVTARVLFRHAAEAGAADGALALGATYDPGVLAKLGVRGIAGDADQARSWYEKARDLGSLEAPRRLKILADR